jgi:hypothetical protein
MSDRNPDEIVEETPDVIDPETLPDPDTDTDEPDTDDETASSS